MWKRPTEPKRGKEEKSRREGRTADDPVVCTFWRGGTESLLGEGGKEYHKYWYYIKVVTVQK